MSKLRRQMKINCYSMLRKLWAFYIGLSLVCQCFCASCCLTLITYHFQCLCNFSINYYKLFVSIKFVSLLLSHLPMYIVSLLYKQAFSIGFKAGCYSRKILKTKKRPPPLTKKTPRSIEKEKRNGSTQHLWKIRLPPRILC